LFIIYSASGSWGDNYCLGQLTWTGGDVLDPKSWVKKANPVFSGTNQVISPGHASFVKSLDGSEDWIVYHTAKHHARAGSGRFRFNGLVGILMILRILAGRSPSACRV